MIKFKMLFAALLIHYLSIAQLQPTEPDLSPMDMSYSPANFPVIKFQANTSAAKLNARVIYSRPQVRGRDIFGSEVRYNELWRIGANESTELDLYKNAMVAGKKVLKGRYTLYCIPTADSWTMILNSDTDSWGAFSYQKALDVARVVVPVQKTDTIVEYLTMYFDAANNLIIMWSDRKVSIPFQFLVK